MIRKTILIGVHFHCVHLPNAELQREFPDIVLLLRRNLLIGVLVLVVHCVTIEAESVELYGERFLEHFKVKIAAEQQSSL